MEIEIDVLVQIIAWHLPAESIVESKKSELCEQIRFFYACVGDNRDYLQVKTVQFFAV